MRASQQIELFSYDRRDGLKGISRSNRSERLYEKPGFTARRFQGRVFPSLLKIPVLRATLISFAPCLSED